MPPTLAVAALLAAGTLDAPPLGPPPDATAAARRVVRAVVARAGGLKTKAGRPAGDVLTGEYVRAAARAASAEAEPVRAAAFLIGLGVALDDSTLLRTNPLTARPARAVEPDAERKERLAVLGEPTARCRRDLCQHFAVSAALVELLGPAGAESAGLAKEMLDMTRPGGSGFSFADLAADYAGLALAGRVKADSKFLATLADRFEVADHVPKVDGLREGITAKQFAADYGSADDQRFQAALAEVQTRVKTLK